MSNSKQTNKQTNKTKIKQTKTKQNKKQKTKNKKQKNKNKTKTKTNVLKQILHSKRYYEYHFFKYSYVFYHYFISSKIEKMIKRYESTLAARTASLDEVSQSKSACRLCFVQRGSDNSVQLCQDCNTPVCSMCGSFTAASEEKAKPVKQVNDFHKYCRQQVFFSLS